MARLGGLLLKLLKNSICRAEKCDPKEGTEGDRCTMAAEMPGFHPALSCPSDLLGNFEGKLGAERRKGQDPNEKVISGMAAGLPVSG